MTFLYRRQRRFTPCPPQFTPLTTDRAEVPRGSLTPSRATEAGKKKSRLTRCPRFLTAFRSALTALAWLLMPRPSTPSPPFWESSRGCSRTSRSSERLACKKKIPHALPLTRVPSHAQRLAQSLAGGPPHRGASHLSGTRQARFCTQFRGRFEPQTVQKTAAEKCREPSPQAIPEGVQTLPRR